MLGIVARKGLSKGVLAVYGQRSISSFQSASSNAGRTGRTSSSTLFKTAGTILPSLTILALAHHSFSTKSILYSENSSNSSSVFREAFDSAFRRPGSQLVFMSINEDNRDEWQHWIGYFRQAGYDCIDLNLALNGSEQKTEKDFSQELGSQIRLMALHKAPLLFVLGEKGAKVGLEHIQSSQPKITGMVLICPKDSEQAVIEEAKKLDTKRLRILILSKEKGQDAFLKTEKWMDAESLS